MQLIPCPVDPCPKGELWNSTFEVQQHMDESHPEVTKWRFLDADHTAIEVSTFEVEAQDVIDAVQEQGLEPYVLADWAISYLSGSFEEVFADTFQETFDLLIARQHKYGPKNIEQQGLYGIFTRLRDDKMSRIARALNGTVVNGHVQINPIEDAESEDTFEDALKDVANYALIMLVLYRGQWGKPLDEELR